VRLDGKSTARAKDVLEDVYFGDLWIASGQSNMELPMARVRVMYPEDVARADLPPIRFCRTPKDADFDRLPIGIIAKAVSQRSDGAEPENWLVLLVLAGIGCMPAQIAMGIIFYALGSTLR
jgi:hypothetical protein